MAAARGDRDDRRRTPSCARTTSSRRSSTATSRRRGRRGRRPGEGPAAPAMARGDEIGYSRRRDRRVQRMRPSARTQAMRVTITGATGLIGSQLVAALRARGDEVVRAVVAALAGAGEPAPAAALAGRDAVVHLAGENVAQRWTDERARAIRDSRERGHAQPRRRRSRAADPRRACWSAPRPSATTARTATSALDEDAPPGDDFLAEVCVAWEREARRGRGARPARGQRAHRRRARRRRRRAGEDAAAVQARRRRPGRRRRPVHAVDPRRRRRRHLPRRARRRRLERARSTPRAPEPVTNAAFSQGARPRAAPPAVAPVPALAIRRSTATWPRSSPRASARSRAARSSSATRSRTRTSTRRCARRAALTQSPCVASPAVLGRGGLRRAATAGRVLALRRPDQPDDDADDAEQQAGAEARLLAVALAVGQLSSRRSREPSQM